jgi:two-component system phosphate regulon response regulator PhoB
LAEVRKSLPDLLILDLMLPTLPGLEICKKARLDQKLNRMPILILTARGDEADRALMTTSPNPSALANWWRV